MFLLQTGSKLYALIARKLQRLDDEHTIIYFIVCLFKPSRSESKPQLRHDYAPLYLGLNKIRKLDHVLTAPGRQTLERQLIPRLQWQQAEHSKLCSDPFH